MPWLPKFYSKYIFKGKEKRPAVVHFGVIKLVFSAGGEQAVAGADLAFEVCATRQSNCKPGG
jgi:hypothetical protein